MHNAINNGRDFTEIIAEMKDELKDVAQLRIAMFKTEVQQKAER